MRVSWIFGAVAVAAMSIVSAGASIAEDEYNPTMIKCTMDYNLSGWSLGVKRQKGEGRIKCDNGVTQDVSLESTGAGFTVGKGKIIGGKGTFSSVTKLDELFGTYASAEASVGATDSGQGVVLTKGEVSLALSGSGKGVEIGASIGGFTIKPK